MKCVICGNKDHFDMVATNDCIRFSCFGKEKFILKCLDCGIVFLYPPWSKKELDEIYSKYLNHKEDFSGQKRDKTISKYIRRYCNRKDKILEVGAGRGDNVRYLLENGYDAVGIDKDPTYCDGVKLINADYKTYNTKVDFIYVIQMFEHVEFPLFFVDRMKRMLKPRGRFLLEVPNLEDPLLLLFKNESFERFYYYPYHTFFYTEKTIKKVFGKMGIVVSVKKSQRYGIINHLRWLILGSPGNWNPHIPILDNIYKFILVHMHGASDTLIVTGVVND